VAIAAVHGDHTLGLGLGLGSLRGYDNPWEGGSNDLDLVT
jgi:hypothetical protein